MRLTTHDMTASTLTELRWDRPGELPWKIAIANERLTVAVAETERVVPLALAVHEELAGLMSRAHLGALGDDPSDPPDGEAVLTFVTASSRERIWQRDVWESSALTRLVARLAELAGAGLDLRPPFP